MNSILVDITFYRLFIGLRKSNFSKTRTHKQILLMALNLVLMKSKQFLSSLLMHYLLHAVLNM